MASTSSAVDSCDSYDVFLSFSGEDTRYNFTSHLHKDLCRNKIKVFIDYKIKRGEKITSTLERTIEAAKISIIVFSKNYAESTFCLDELVKIMECRESKNQIVLPIFYKVEPSEATYREAFEKHKAKSDREKGLQQETIKELKKWKSAFREAIELAGWHIQKNSDEVDIIEKITTAISEILKSGQSKGEELMCTSIVGETAEVIYKRVWKCLMNDNVSRVGIYGMGGVGKTTIATRINDELLFSKAFPHVCWVTVSKELSIYKLQNGIAKMIELDLSQEDDERKRAAKLRNNLKNKKILLILDDLWEAIEIEEVGIPPLISGQKLLLTSRNRRVCERMECKSFEVKPLLEHEALALFKRESKFKISDSLEWKEIVSSIVRECAGLPLAIVVVARRMRGVVEIREWRNTLRELQKPCEGENHEMEEKVFRSLMFSYDRLPNNKFQQCFLYCALFPEDYGFKRDTLIKYWIGEGLIDELYSTQEKFDKGHCMLDELINSSLLERDREGHLVKMHDVVRDMALIVIRENFKAQDGLRLQGLSKENERCVNLNSVLFMKDLRLERGIPKLASNCSELRTLVFQQCCLELPSSFFANMQHLVVLDMSFLEELKLLPDSISNLGNLRVLLLYWCTSLEYIPSIGELKNLCHLDLSYTNLKEIPNGMERLIKLNVLKLSRKRAFYSLNAFFSSAGFLEKLSNLQILELIHVEVEADVLISLEKLENLRIAFYSLESLNSYLKSGHWRRLEEYYIFCFREKGSSEHRMAWENACKKEMLIEERKDFGGRKGETDMVLPNNIQSLELERWNGGMVNVVMNSTFDNLQRLEISWCFDMKHLLTPAMVQRLLLNVETLRFYCCKVEEIISSEEELRGEINEYPTIQLPKLKSLRLTSLRFLRSIYKGRMVCPSLEYIEVLNCGKLERLPFSMQEERNKQDPIKLDALQMPNQWWDSLHWDHPNAKSRYQLNILDPTDH